MTTKNADFGEIQSAAAKVRGALQALREERAALTEESNALKQTRERLLAQPVPLEDLKAFLCEYVDAKGNEFMSRLAGELDQFIHPPRQLSYQDQQKGLPPLGFEEMEKLLADGGEAGITGSGVPQFVIPVKNNHKTDIGFYFFFGEQIKAVITERFDELGIKYRVGSSYIGTPRAERRQQLAEIDARLVEIGSRMTEINGQISSLGAVK